MTATAVAISLRDAEEFLYREARFADEHRYDDWEALWTDEALYWVPANGDETDPTRQMSIIFDNRARIATRIKQFHTGKRHSQMPPSRVRTTPWPSKFFRPSRTTWLSLSSTGTLCRRTKTWACGATCGSPPPVR